MGKYVHVSRFQTNGQRRMSDREKYEWVRLLWFLIAVTFVIQLAMLLDAYKSFF